MKNDSNDIRSRIKTMMEEQGVTMKTVADRLNENREDFVKPSDITNKLQRQTLRLSEAIDIADVLGYDVVFMKREPEMDQEMKARALKYAMKLLETELDRTK